MKLFLRFPKKLLIAIAAITLVSNAHGQFTTFQKYLGGSGFDYLYDLHKTSDGGYLCGALTTSFPGPWVRSWIVKTDVNGDTLWTSVFSDTNGGACSQQYINDIAPASDGGAVCGGGKSVCGDSTKGGNIARVDATGKVKWAKYFPINCDPYPIIQCTDGNFVTGGYIVLSGGYLSPKNGFLTKVDSATGDTIWSRYYGHGPGAGVEWFYHILQTPDGGYLAAGYTTSYGQGGEDIYLVKTDGNGNLQWSKTYGTALNELAFGHCLWPTSDGGFIVTGPIGPGGPGKKSIFLLKIDASGNAQWAKAYDGDFSHGVRQTPDGGYVVSGGNSAGNVLLIRTDGAGSVVWSETYAQGAGNVVELAGDGGYVTGGQVNVGPFGNKDLYLIKTDSVGNSGCNQAAGGVHDSVINFIVTNPPTKVGIGASTVSYPIAMTRGGKTNTGCMVLSTNEIKNTSESVSVYPNPVQYSATVSFERTGLHTIELYDVTGRKINSFISHDKEYALPCTDLSEGVYFIKITSIQSTQVIKFVKE